jgi:rhodanese-related sulfurtransferase
MRGHRNHYLLIATGVATLASAQSNPNIFKATLLEPNQKTPELSTEELRTILSEKSATVFDTRPFKEYAISHIPSTVNVAAKPGVAISEYVSDVAEIGRLLGGKKAAPIVLYCNGPFCGKSKRLSEELLAAGHTNIRRYQLGIPVWRALGEVTVIEPEGIRIVMAQDQSAVLLDARDPEEFRTTGITRAKNVPASALKPGKDVGEIKKAKDDGRLPMEDHNTRIIVFGRDGSQARALAEALAKEAFHNVAYFDGSIQNLKLAAK